jgi:hypothetical protein
MSVVAEGTGRIVMELYYYTSYITVMLTSDICNNMFLLADVFGMLV